MKKLFYFESLGIETKMFRTLQAAQNFINKSEGRTIVFFRAHEYYVSI